MACTAIVPYEPPPSLDPTNVTARLHVPRPLRDPIMPGRSLPMYAMLPIDPPPLRWRFSDSLLPLYLITSEEFDMADPTGHDRPAAASRRIRLSC